METSLGFLKQTASDYDLPLNEVKRVYEKYRGAGFYKALEQLLIDRRNSNCYKALEPLILKV
jgi:hypothetical protein